MTEMPRDNDCPPLACHPIKRCYQEGDPDEDVSTSSQTSSSGGSLSDGRTVQVARLRDSPDEIFQKSMVNMLNKRGYNVRETSFNLLAVSPSPAMESTESLSGSFSSTTSSISSVILGLREPNHGQGPLHIAIRKGDCQVIDAILSNECVEEVVNATDNNGNTALHFAAGSWRRPQCASIVQSLLVSGARVHAPNKRGLTPIGVHMLTVKVDNPVIVAMLLENGANANTEVEGVSILHHAARRSFAAIASVLVSHGASMAALNQDGLMCIEVASMRVKRFMLRSIASAPPFVPVTQRSKCMRCNSALYTTKKLVSNFFRRLVGGKISPHQFNCYHCGFLYCSKCLKYSNVADVLPSGFLRCRNDDLANVKTCIFCEAILRERRQNKSARNSFDQSALGYCPAA